MGVCVCVCTAQSREALAMECQVGTYLLDNKVF